MSNQGTIAGKLVVLSGPSGVGKSTVVKQVLEACAQPIVLSVSATTRRPRTGEVDGQHYHFVNSQQFQQHRREGDFLEAAEVFGQGYWYGTLRQPVFDSLHKGIHVVLEIDVVGAKMVLDQFPNSLSVFIHPGSLEELETRLRGRKTETEANIQRRLAVAKTELEQIELYTHVVVNRDVQQTAQQICNIICETETPRNV